MLQATTKKMVFKTFANIYLFSQRHKPLNWNKCYLLYKSGFLRQDEVGLLSEQLILWLLFLKELNKAPYAVQYNTGVG